jgi:hypothetical protein
MGRSRNESRLLSLTSHLRLLLELACDGMEQEHAMRLSIDLACSVVASSHHRAQPRRRGLPCSLAAGPREGSTRALNASITLRRGRRRCWRRWCARGDELSPDVGYPASARH